MFDFINEFILPHNLTLSLLLEKLKNIEKLLSLYLTPLSLIKNILITCFASIDFYTFICK